jgi:hypothetical protein
MRFKAPEERGKKERSFGDPSLVVWDARPMDPPRGHYFEDPIARELRGASIEARRVVEGDLRFPVPRQAAEESELLAVRRVGQMLAPSSAEVRTAA